MQLTRSRYSKFQIWYFHGISEIAIYQRDLTLCTPMSSVTQRQCLSQELLCRDPPDIPLCPPISVKRAKENQDRILEIVSRYIIHLKITK